VNYAGIPDLENWRRLPCGCELVRVALAGNPEVYTRRCDEHREAS
jgi:hypothetical protein